MRRERQKLLAAVPSGQAIVGLLEALQALEERESALTSQLTAIAAQRPIGRVDAARMRRDLIELSQSWRHVLAEDPGNARRIVASLLKGRVTITPSKVRVWAMQGEASLDGLFERTIYPSVVRPHGDPVACIRCAECR